MPKREREPGERVRRRDGGGGRRTLLAGASKEQLAKALENSAKKMKSLDKKVAARGFVHSLVWFIGVVVSRCSTDE